MNTIHNIVSIFEHFTDTLNFDKTNFQNSSTWDDINDAIRRIFRIDNFLTNSSKIGEKQPLFDSSLSEKSQHGYCELNNQYIGYKITDLVKVEFTGFYPNIICRLIEEGSIEIELKSEPYYYFIKNSNEIKPNLSRDAGLVFRLYVNYFFGYKLPIEDRKKVIARGNQILEFFSKYDNWIYSDVDQFFIKDSLGLITQIESDMRIFELPYQICLIKEAVFMAKKKLFYITDSGAGYMKGFHTKNKK